MGWQLLSSLLLTLVICFTLPAIGLGVTLGTLTLGINSPLSVLSEWARSQLIDILSVFGAGHPAHGVFIICLTLSIVGGLFEGFTFYKHTYLKQC